MKKSITLAALAGLFLTSPATATIGLAPVGVGQAAKGSGGATVALPQDTLIVATNPAGIVDLGHRLDAGVEVFCPHKRGFDINALQISGDGSHNANCFFVPEFGYSRVINDNLALGIAVYGNGGMNTQYKPHPLFRSDTKIDYAQLFIAPTIAWKFNDLHSIGITPLIAIHSFEAILPTIPPGASSVLPRGFPGAFGGHKTGYGLGIRVGWLGKVSDKISLGAAYQSEIKMSKLDDYRHNILAGDDGRLNVPANATIGIAFHATPQLDILFDVQKIWYSDTGIIGKPTSQGGFGWDDTLSFKLGVVYRYNDRLTLRAGVAIVDESPVPNTTDLDFAFSTLTPAITKEHLTLGLTYAINDRVSITGSYIHTFKETQSQALSQNFGGANASLNMEQDALGVSLNYKF